MIKHSRSQELIDYAIQLATEWHEGQVRKYAGEPYIIHPIAVANEATSFSVGVKIIRLADILHNCDSIIEQDPKHTLKKN